MRWNVERPFGSGWLCSVWERAGRAGALVLFLVALSGLLSASSVPCVWTGVERIVAVGDLHGDYQHFLEILRNPKVGLLDEDLHWSGGRTHLVQMGDILDRGDRAKDILDLLMRLEAEAAAAGGKVHVLIGNHEESTITGISLGYPDYVSPKQFVSFLPADFRKAREREYYARPARRDRNDVLSGRGDLNGDPGLVEFWNNILILIRQRQDPAAALAYVEGFNKVYGKWLLTKNAVIRINDIIFAHGGISRAFSTWSIQDINDTLRLELGAYALHPDRPPTLGGQPFEPRVVYNPQAPSWYRQDDAGSQAEIDAILSNLGANRIVVGHDFLGSGGESPIVRRASDVPRFENKVWMIDTGIGYADVGGLLFALIIDKGTFDFYAASEGGAGGTRPAAQGGEGPRTAEEIERFLERATPQIVVSGAAGRTDPWRVSLASDGAILWGQFKYIRRPRPEPIPDSYTYELAAYRLSRYLGLRLVPPVVERMIKDTPGALQAFVENALSEADRKKDGIPPPDPEAYDRAMADLKVFENLVREDCGNDKDTLVRKDTGEVYRVDFSQAFAPETGLAPGCPIRRCSQALYRALLGWQRDKVRALLEPYLNEAEMQALHARRDALVAAIRREIESRGETAVLF
jgi:hypothetical protein